MYGQTLKFLLVPDSSAARRIRRIIAEPGGCSGVVAGSWPELMEWAWRVYLLPAYTDNWEGTFRKTLAKIENAFWSESLSVAPEETSAAIESALVQIVSNTDPIGGVDERRLDDLSARPGRHLSDLFRLHKLLAGYLPEDLFTIRNLLSAEVRDALHTIRVYHTDGFPNLTRWQAALVEKLNQDADIKSVAGVPDDLLMNILNSIYSDVSARDAQSSLRMLQSRLFETTDHKTEIDESVQWVGVRDFLQEAEVAVGMVQTVLVENPELKPADIGLLIPDSFEYSFAVQNACRLGGISLSGLPEVRWRRDLGREAVFNFLYCRQKPAPAMALAVCLSSPLMPWSREDGTLLAQAVMDGDYRLRPPPAACNDALAILDLLRTGDSEPGTLLQALRTFVALLSGGDELADHVNQAKAAVENIRAELENAVEIDWVSLRRALSPRLVTSAVSPDFNLEGVTVWRESQEPWRPVRRLIVLGLAQGHYPLASGSSPVFSADDLQAIRDYTRLPVRTPTDEMAQQRLRFVRQLGAVTDAVTFLIPRRDPGGAVQAHSESLVFMHQLLSGPESAEALIMELDASNDRARVRDLALAATALPQPPRALLADDMRFDRDLLALRTDAEGRLQPESPSSLETLMISRLAWLLRRLDAEPFVWAPESADTAILGTLAHKVFEGLFRPGECLPARDEIPERVEALLNEAIRQSAPFLSASQWQVERRHFIAGTTKAAQDWRDVLERLGAKVLVSEAWLQGSWSSIPIHGQTDLILGLSDDRLLVVDYKRSASKNRRPRMDRGYDSQASLYLAMLRSGGPKGVVNKALIARLRATARTSIVYYMLNDQVSLTDSMLPESAAIPGWHVLQDDVAGRAMALIQRRLTEVRAGALCLNRDGDAEFFEKRAGIKPYALDNSPLISLFTLPGVAVEAQ